MRFAIARGTFFCGKSFRSAGSTFVLAQRSAITGTVLAPAAFACGMVFTRKYRDNNKCDDQANYDVHYRDVRTARRPVQPRNSILSARIAHQWNTPPSACSIVLQVGLG